MKIGIVVRDDNFNRNAQISQIIEILLKHHAEIYSMKNEISLINTIPLAKINFYKTVELIIVLGGDGTLLRVAKFATNYDIPILGVNFGRIGYLTDLEKNDIHLIENIFSKNYIIDKRMLLDGEITKNNEVVSHFSSLNDIVISRGNFTKMIELDMFVDNDFVSTLRADGLIISTPTGSTAYSLSAGGSVIDPTAEIIAVTPICPHTLNSRPIIMSKNRKIKIRHNNIAEDYSHIAVDGDFLIPFDSNCEMKISVSEKTTKLIRIINRNFYSILKEKL